MSRIHKELGVRFQLATIFDAPTIAGLAAKVLEVRPDLDAELAAAAAADGDRRADRRPRAGGRRRRPPPRSPSRRTSRS